MTGYLIDYKGDTYKLPKLFSWTVNHGLGTPCDAFEICFVYESYMADILSGAVRFKGTFDGKTVFYGIVDEYEINIDSSGCSASVSGRGLAGILLDNEAEAVQYSVCSLNDIIANHVKPYGITDMLVSASGYANNYRVDSGRSEWSALYEFARFACNVTPYFTREGKLMLTPIDGQRLYIDDRSGVFDVKYREKRYDRISEALVKNNTRDVSVTVENSSFLKKGGMCRRVINVPRNTGYDSMRYTGMYQIKCADEEHIVLEFTIPQLFAAFPNDIVDVKLASFGLIGQYRVKETSVWADGTSCGTKVRLIKK